MWNIQNIVFSPIQLRSQVGEGRCYNVSQGRAKDQVAEVLEHFNVKVAYGDIFSRCQVSRNRGLWRSKGLYKAGPVEVKGVI